MFQILNLNVRAHLEPKMEPFSIGFKLRIEMNKFKTTNENENVLMKTTKTKNENYNVQTKTNVYKLKTTNENDNVQMKTKENEKW